MRKNANLQQLIRASVLIAIGVILPQIFHGVKDAGSVFLPMHIPVLIGGFILNPLYAALVGIITPVMSHLLTGMPPFPFVYVMILELAAYGILISLIYNKGKRNIYVALISSMLLGRAVNIAGNYIILHLFMNKPFNIKMVITGLFVKGLPGIAIQLALVPVIVLALKKSLYKSVAEYER